MTGTGTLLIPVESGIFCKGVVAVVTFGWVLGRVPLTVALVVGAFVGNEFAPLTVFVWFVAVTGVVEVTLG